MNRPLAACYLIAAVWIGCIVWYQWPVEMPVVEAPGYPQVYPSPTFVIYDHALTPEEVEQITEVMLERGFRPDPCWLTPNQIQSLPDLNRTYEIVDVPNTTTVTITGAQYE